MTKDEAMRMALEALERSMEAGLTGIKVDKAITALRQALEQPKRHVSYVCPQCYWTLEHPSQDLIVGYADVHDLTRDGHDFWVSRQPGKNTVPLYLYGHPPKIWQGLTDEERYLNDCRSEEEIGYARAIEAKLKEKNT